MSVRLLAPAFPLVMPMSASMSMTAARRMKTSQFHKAARGSFFTCLGLPKSPDLDVSAVQRAYHELQRRVHPDQANVQAREVAEKRKAISSSNNAEGAENEEDKENTVIGRADTDASVYVNASYETLRDPYLRCRYLMRLSRAEEVKGSQLTPAEEEALMHDDDSRSVKENQKLRNDNKGSDVMSLPPEFLEELMVANETVFSTDPSQEEDLAKLQLLIAHFEERYEECYEKAKKYWKKEDMHQFFQSVMEWTYIRNVLKHAKDRIV